MKLVYADKIAKSLRAVLAEHVGDDESLAHRAFEAMLIAVEAEPAVEAVPKGAYDQVAWERDVAIDQLASYGVGFGEKADVAKVVHARCVNGRCTACGLKVNEYDRFCAECGAKMDLPSISGNTQAALDAIGRRAHGEVDFDYEAED